MFSSQVQINLDAIRHNVRLIKQFVGPSVAVLAAVKANGYGHGAVAVAKAALEAGATWLGVAQLAEAVALREAGLAGPILVLGHTSAALAAQAIQLQLHITLTDLATARAFSAAAVAAQTVCWVHIKIDTGMGRLGVLPDDAQAFIAQVSALPNIALAGIFTHFSCADSDPIYTQYQIQQFERIVLSAKLEVLSLPSSAHIHACNSAGLMAYPQAHFDLVRLGIAMYGLSPFAPTDAPTAAAQAIIAQLRPALAWHTHITSLKTLPDGWAVSYGATYRCVGPRRIAAIPVGYGDGFRRAPQHFGEVLVHNRRAPIVGRVCMDQSMIDVTDIPDVGLGDEVVIIGRQGDDQITVDAVAARVGTINYDIVTSLLTRPARVYLD